VSAAAAPAATLDRTLTALADPTRREVIDLLRAGPRRASEIAEELRMSRPAMSRHLRVLRKSGLVTENDLEHDARVRLYRLERRPFSELRGWLDEVEAFWTDQLASFKAHLERKRRPGGRR
jgi:DNA-binding transcriptional ArsR family regulator